MPFFLRLPSVKKYTHLYPKRGRYFKSPFSKYFIGFHFFPPYIGGINSGSVVPTEFFFFRTSSRFLRAPRAFLISFSRFGAFFLYSLSFKYICKYWLSGLLPPPLLRSSLMADPPPRSLPPTQILLSFSRIEYL